MPKFKLYSAKLRLAGSVLNEVPLVDVTAAEIDLFRLIHGGDDAVVNVRETGQDERSHADERARINQKFAGGDDNIEGQAKKKLAMIRELFGHDRLPLPLALDSEGDVEPEEPIEEAPAPRIKRTVVKKAEVTPAFAE